MGNRCVPLDRVNTLEIFIFPEFFFAPPPKAEAIKITPSEFRTSLIKINSGDNQKRNEILSNLLQHCERVDFQSKAVFSI